MPSTLVLGGIRSGKSRLAESQVANAGGDGPVVYVATAEALDAEMQKRIAAHQANRPDDWELVEEPLALGRVLAEQGRRNPVPALLIDCMSLWLSNALHAGDTAYSQHRAAFLEALSDYPGPVVIVSNEVGLGTIGMDKLTRRFADELGWLNQSLADLSDRVLMSVAGQSLTLKDSGAVE